MSYMRSALSLLLPTSYTIGTSLGEKTAVTYGPNISNKAIEIVVSKFFNVQRRQLSVWEQIKEKVTGVAQITFTESLKLAVTPKAMPFIQALGAGFWGSSFINYNWYCNYFIWKNQ